ncbi:protein-glutamate methylesterase/protein-glutamine glutaminase [Anoxynatronum buryatiense]|uniref:Protein-glutamate methylesterase/protein-glutamine glutaminase n=1 Tax=Anoxynatronum buryatiense TaxID=489973 RepID=A0AA45WVA5_9CLOT|nr:chemotaxis response regulator protein-glutamate methylesterase [Anoxynatronum buryatiense]SMP47395.1 two-component system, chemotaxis family, response regulator CheB [Anoxynatronum buryatiense]
MRNPSTPIRVLVVDDSAFMRKVINDILHSDPLIQVIAHARNGKEAMGIIAQDKPDVITLDIEMPVMDGLETLEAVMKECPVPVIMLSSLTEEGSPETIRALELGAVDFIQKPTLSFMITSGQFRNDLIAKIKESISYRVQVTPTHVPTRMKREMEVQVKEHPKSAKKERIEDSYTRLEAKEMIEKPPVRGMKMTTVEESSLSIKRLVAIAVSTGGPKALQSVIPFLPQNLSLPVLVVQHMPPGFTKSLAERLNQLSQVTVKEAEQSEIIQPGTVYIAPGDYHLTVKPSRHRLHVELTREDPVGGHRPAADRMFDSLAESSVEEVICVVMTGMGADGTKGIKNLKCVTKTYVLAQDEQSCVVYGMPKSAVVAGVVDQVVSLERITDAITNRIGGR